MKPVLLAFTLFLFVQNALSAFHNGTVSGLVTDRETRLEIPSAIVRLAPLGLAMATNDIGGFLFSDLEAGEYVISVSFVGYETASQTVRVTDHETTTLLFELKTAPLDLANIEISAGKRDPLSSFSALDIQMKPVNSAQEVLRLVPGVVIAQHAGGGKAEQIFLRGFDIDHGTDIALTVDDLPVNLVSHAHGQGYADLHFVIPELIERVDFQKGVYDPAVGNFGTAGAVKFRTADALSTSFLKMEGGQFGTGRGAGAFDLLGEKLRGRGQSAYLAGEYLFSNGWFEAPQDFHRVNILAKYRGQFDENRTVTASFSQFSSRWNASGQVPERAVESGQIGRFGAIDSNEGGQTSRQNLNLQMTRALSENRLLKQQLAWSRYRFELFSNFTFFLEDSINGDQIRQKETRDLFKYATSLHQRGVFLGKNMDLEAGFQLRFDQTDGSELSHTRNRIVLLNRLAFGNVSELNAGFYASARVDLSSNWSLKMGSRFDQFRFGYQNSLDSSSARPFSAVSKSIVSPKTTLHFSPNRQLDFYVAAGSGFHSNDSRTILGGQVADILPRALGLDAGFSFKPTPNWLFAAAFWTLGLEQEFVYVGDAAIVEPGGETRRRGFDLSTRLQIGRRFFVDADYAFSHGRAVGEPEGADHIPLAPVHVGQGGLTYSGSQGLGGSVRSRFMADRPANADNSLVAEGFFLLDATLNFRKKMFEINLSAQNLLDSAWKEAQFETESRLKNEAAPVTEIHFTPGSPRFLKAGLTVFF